MKEKVVVKIWNFRFLEANASLVVGMSVRQSVFCLLSVCSTFHQFLVLGSTVLKFLSPIKLMRVDEGS